MYASSHSLEINHSKGRAINYMLRIHLAWDSVSDLADDLFL
uniref:Uncharacterized protein n=1 Tax=Anguilla anguilla TaxID=7936 RepID=A0A0E9S644_ANGAN